MSTDYLRIQYAAEPETRIYPEEEGGRTINKILLGTWAGVVEDNGRERVRVVTAGRNGWVDRNHLRDSCGLKIFFVDVGQGDGMLIETASKRLLLDGGPNTNLLRYLRGYQYRYLLGADEKIHIDTVFVSHFDVDHYNGLTAILEDQHFSFGTVYHNGIARFKSRTSSRPPGYNTDLGVRKNDVLKTTFNGLSDVDRLLATGGMQSTFRRFLEAVRKAKQENRLQSVRRLTVRDDHVPGYGAGSELAIQVLGPVPRHPSGRIDWPWFETSSHTRNGHSLVLKLTYSENGSNSKSILLGGDLNAASQNYLLQHYGVDNPFQVDVAKSCHHGSSDFSVNFMKQLKPFATVISSGDNESYAHPRAEALGCAGKYSRGARPKVFSTELARSVRSGTDVLYGMINFRTDGQKLIMAQMKERRTGADIWDSYVI